MKHHLKYLILFCVMGIGSLHGAYPCSTGCIPETDDDLRRKGVTLYSLCPQTPTPSGLSAGTGAGATSLEKLTEKNHRTSYNHRSQQNTFLDVSC